MKNSMSAFESNNPFDLLGQAPPPPAVSQLPGSNEPQLDLGWGQFHQGIAANFAELFRRAKVSKNLLSASIFKDAWIERRLPRRAIFAAALCHIAFIAMPFPQISGPEINPAFANAQVTWSGQIEDFPLLEIPAAKPKSVARATQAQPAASASADAFHPRQRIFTDPVHPTHPRQTLINPSAPPIAPRILPVLPNMVQLAQSAAPARPRLEISQETLRKLRPREKRITVSSNALAPELQPSDRAADLTLTATNSGPERPKLQINAGVAPRASQRKQDGDSDSAPDVAAQLTSPTGSGQALIALSANPGPPAPVAPPAGNLAARVSISPEGKRSDPSGAPPGARSSGGGNAANSGGGGTNSTGVSISGGAPRSANITSGIGAGKIAMPSSRPLYTRAEADRAADEPNEKTGPPNFALLAPGAKPETVFARRRVYSMNVNMPNLNSATGSWILNFTAMRSPSAGPHADSSGEIAEPTPVHKVDPKYPPTLIADHVEGEVILYAVIRRDGSVDGIQVVHGIDTQLDANAVRALAQWKFRPAERQGEPVDLEAIVHIPFHAPEEP
ncbi:MAG TPA: energy transducer TonB [Candidatus Acidoferrum sp.]|jgi:protein TonB